MQNVDWEGNELKSLKCGDGMNEMCCYIKQWKGINKIKGK